MKTLTDPEVSPTGVVFFQGDRTSKPLIHADVP